MKYKIIPFMEVSVDCRRCICVGLPNSWSHFTAITSLCNINWMSRIMNWTKFVSLTSPHLPSQSSLASHVTCWLENGNKIFPQFSIIGIFIPANFSFRDSNVTLLQQLLTVLPLLLWLHKHFMLWLDVVQRPKVFFRLLYTLYFSF